MLICQVECRCRPPAGSASLTGSTMDRFHQLTAFVAVADAGGFSAAARRTGDAQSVISKAVSALERRLGVQLLNRSTRSVKLTEHGKTYCERIGAFLGDQSGSRRRFKLWKSHFARRALCLSGRHKRTYDSPHM